MKKFLYQGAALLCLPLSAVAQSSAIDAAASVPTVGYRSVFTDTPRGVEAETMDWRAANAEVGKNTRGHMDILKWEAAQAKTQSAKQPGPASSSAKPGVIKP